MKRIYIVAWLFVFWSCSKDNLNECGLVGEWLCCAPSQYCTTIVQGQPITEKWTFEEDGDLFIDDIFSTYAKWNTDDNCTELIIDYGVDGDGKYKIDINGDKLVVHYGSLSGDHTLCRQ
jgi:hypothetical protein